MDKLPSMSAVYHIPSFISRCRQHYDQAKESSSELVVSYWQGSGTVLVPERNFEPASAFRPKKIIGSEPEKSVRSGT